MEKQNEIPRPEFLEIFLETDLIEGLESLPIEKWNLLDFFYCTRALEPFSISLHCRPILRENVKENFYEMYVSWPYKSDGKPSVRVFTGPSVERLYKKIDKSATEGKVQRINIYYS